MFLRYVYYDGLAQTSYLVGCQSSGQAIVIDPSRHIQQYVDLANREGMRIVGVCETHIHADFVSGAKQFAEQYGVTLYLSGEGGADWQYEYLDGLPHVLLHDGHEFRIGNLLFRVLHTPGHTPEHISFLLTDESSAAKQPIGLFSGDFVFVGDVGRPDLLEKSVGIAGTSTEMAGKMYDSLQRLRLLPDFLQIWPGHGAGSSCGRALGAVPSTTLGYEKIANWAFQELDRDEFIQRLLSGQPQPPKYFAKMKQVNRQGPDRLPTIEPTQFTSISKTTLSLWAERGVILDVRPSRDFADSHVRGSLNIPYGKSFLTWAGSLLSYDKAIYLIGDERVIPSVIRDLQAIGMDGVEGWLDWETSRSQLDESVFQSYRRIDAAAAKTLVDERKFTVLDVRNLDEWNAGHVDGAIRIAVTDLPAKVHDIHAERPVLVHCQSGYRSAIAASILQANGMEEVWDLTGGYHSWKQVEA
ncbi:MBL fold metallo-hydrolase [Alicyclobacillus acidiphilus]|uniref:MBL fold metallo-hydrolase n=1 Tax=Alicyclobacillus acidiphilus TaxID=182455 RepID=UPI0008301235|nr:MBL fold metallo-hydrolase [Alicyclobacillus acidiphilus]